MRHDTTGEFHTSRRASTTEDSQSELTRLAATQGIKPVRDITHASQLYGCEELWAAIRRERGKAR